MEFFKIRRDIPFMENALIFNVISFLTFAADEGKFARSRVFCAECCRRGVYFHPHHNWFLSAAHGEDDIRTTLEATDEAFALVRRKFGM